MTLFAARIRPFLLVSLLATGLQVPQVLAQVNPCEHERARWVPSRYYDRGELVYHKGAWYEAQHWHSGTEPQHNGSFAWRPVEDAPSCEALSQELQKPVTSEPSSSSAPGKEPSAFGKESAPVTESSTPQTEPAAPNGEPVATKPTHMPSPASAEPAATNPSARPAESASGTDASTASASPAQPNAAPAATAPAESAQPADATGSGFLTRIRNLLSDDSDTAQLKCDQISAWSFAVSYPVGAHVRHEGQYYRAIRPNNGHMPGSLTPPPAWQPAELQCP